MTWPSFPAPTAGQHRAQGLNLASRFTGWPALEPNYSSTTQRTLQALRHMYKRGCVSVIFLGEFGRSPTRFEASQAGPRSFCSDKTK